MTTNIISNRDCTHSNHRSEQASTLLHAPTDRQTIHKCKLRNTYHNKAARIKNLQENRL